MRGFVKKLASAMALTMVVSSVAPAGAVFADDVAHVAMQGSDGAVKDITLTLGGLVDFRFVGAPDNWKDLGFYWRSSSPEVATVNQAGVVEAKSEGLTKITIGFKKDKWEASTWVNVKAPEGNPEDPVYLAYQNTMDKVTDAHVLVGGELDFCFWNAPEGWNANGNWGWETSDAEVATVARDGKVTGHKDGKATISLVLQGEVAASVNVTVGNPVEEEKEDVLETIDIIACYTGIDEETGEKVQYMLDGDVLTVDETRELSVYYEGSLNGEYFSKFYEDFEWTSSNTDIVKVENGVLVAVAAGEAVVTATGVVEGFEQTVNATINVEEPVIDKSYTVTQKTDKQIVLTFADAEVAATVTKDILKLVKVRTAGTTSFPINTVEVKDKEVIVTTYAAFGDGDKYLITVGEEEGKEFTTTLGDVDEITISYKSYEDETAMTAGDGVAFANPEDEDSITVKLSAKLFSNGVDVTSAADYSVEDVTYTLYGDYDDEAVSLDDEGTLTFYKAGATVVVEATYTYEDAKEEEQTVTAYIEIISEKAPAYEIETVKEWTFVSADQEKIDWAKPEHDVRAGDEAYIVALITDSYGNTYVTDSNFATDDYKYIYGDESKFEKEGYELRFSSSDVAKMIVDENTDGVEVKTYKKVSNVGVLFSLYNDETEKTEDFYCAEFDVKEARALTSVTIDKTDFTLPTEGDYTSGKVTIKLLDQDGSAWASGEDVTIKANSDKIVDTKATYIGDGKYEFSFDGINLAAKVEKEAKKDVTITFTAKAGNKTATFKVTLKTPSATGKITYGLEAGNVSQTIGGDDTSAVKKSTISFYQYKSKLKMSKEDTTLVASSGALETLLQAKEGTVNKGDKFLVVYKPDGSVLAEVATDSALGVYDKGDGTYEVVVATTKKSEVASNDSLAMDYAPTGTYKAEVLEVTGFNSKDVAKFTKYDAEFTVENTNKAVAVAKQTKLASTEGGVEDIILDAIAFTLGGEEWKPTTENLIACDVIETEDYVVVKKVTFKVAVNDKITDTYYEVEVPVEMTIQKAE